MSMVSRKKGIQKNRKEFPTMIIEQAVAQALGFDTEKITSQVSNVVSHVKSTGDDMRADSAAILAKGN